MASTTSEAKAFKPKRGRPNASQVVAIDAAIVATAREMFLKHGYANTSMEAVASTVGVAKGTLYARYPRKSDLFHAIVVDRIAAWSAATPAIGSADEPLAEVLKRTGCYLLEALMSPEVAAFDRLIMSEAPRFPELHREFSDQGFAPFVARVASAIKEAAVREGRPATDPASVAEHFISALLGWHRRFSSEPPGKKAIASYVARLVALLDGGREVW